MKPGMKAGSIAAVIVIATMCSARAIETRYSCADGTGIIAVFSPPDQSPGDVQLSFNGSPDIICLPQLRSADGGRYQKDTTEFWIKGNNATLARRGNSTICKGQ